MYDDPNMDLETRFQMEQRRKAMMERVVKNVNYDEVYRIVESLKPEEKSFLYPDSFGEFVEPKFLVTRQVYYVLPNDIPPEAIPNIPEEVIRQLRLPVGFADAFLLNPRSTTIAYLFVAISPQFRKKYVSPVLIKGIVQNLQDKGFNNLFMVADSLSPCFNEVIKMANRNKFVRNRNLPNGILFSRKI